MTARLQAATTSGKPILLRLDYAAGHGIGSTKTQVEQELADESEFFYSGSSGWLCSQPPDQKNEASLKNARAAAYVENIRFGGRMPAS